MGEAVPPLIGAYLAVLVFAEKSWSRKCPVIAAISLFFTSFLTLNLNLSRLESANFPFVILGYTRLFEGSARRTERQFK